MTNILNILSTFLVTQNGNLINILSIPLFFLENALGMLLFTTILNIPATKKQKLTYILISSILSIFSKFIIPDPINTIVNIALFPFIIYFTFKTSIFKCILSELLPIIIGALIESPLLKIYNLIFNITQTQAYTIPVYRFSFMIIYYLILFALYILCKKSKFNITILDNLNKRTKKLFIANFLLMILSFILQSILVSFYIDNLPITITITLMLILLGYYSISMYSLINTTKLELTFKDLEQSQLYNKTLTILHDNIRCFKHDFNNIVTTLGGYIYSEDLNGLKKYYCQLVKDCQCSNNLSALNPNVINDPAVYSLLTNKYHTATALGITVNIDSFLDFNTLNMNIYEFTRIFGILLDNAIEASKECDEKLINITIRKDISVNRQLLIIENTYNNKDINTEKIFEKNYSTKPNNTGLGLWEIRRILTKNNNLNLYTTKDHTYFKQQLEIYA